MNEYRLYWTLTARVLTMGIPLFMLVGGLGMIVSLVISGEEPGPLAFVLFWTAMVVFFAMHSCRLPTQIRLSTDGKVRFKGWLREFEVGVGDIESIKPGGNNLGFLVVKTRRGKITILNQFDGFHEFLTRVKELNPAVEMRGC